MVGFLQEAVLAAAATSTGPGPPCRPDGASVPSWSDVDSEINNEREINFLNLVFEKKKRKMSSDSFSSCHHCFKHSQTTMN